MQRRTFLKAAGAGLFAVIGAGAVGWSQLPVIPRRPKPDADTALGWIAYQGGRYTLTLPRAEMGQNIATSMKQIACSELGVTWDAVDLTLHDTSIDRVKATVGSESIMQFAEPLAQACAALRDAVEGGRSSGEVSVTTRPVEELRAFQPGSLIGHASRLEQGMEIVTGAPLYAADQRLEGMVFGRVLRAPASVEVASRPLAWNQHAAESVPGFLAIVEECGPPIGQARGIGIVTDRPGALDRVADALAVQWDISGAHPRADVDAAIDVDRHLSNGLLPHEAVAGRPEEGPWDVDLRIDLPPAAHAFIEPRASVALWQGQSLSVWTGTQDAFYVRDVLRDAFSVTDVTVQGRRIGGAFGGKTICTVEAEAAALSRSVGLPVKVQWTRQQEYALAFHRPPSSHRIKARVQAGRLTDWAHDQVSSHILFTSAVAPTWMQRGTDLAIGDPGVSRGMVPPYDITRTHAAYKAVRLPIHTGPWRGLGAGQNGLAMESAIDEAARAAGLDPLEFRLRNMTDPLLAGVVKRVAENAGWGADLPVRAGERGGRGLACGIYKETSYAAVIADVYVDVLGSVRVEKLWCVHDCGLVINPDQVRAQCEGNLVWSLGMILSDDLPMEHGRATAETFVDSPIPTQSGVPPISVDLIVSDRPPQGAGETAIAAGPGAIANAIRDATGLRPTRFPVRSDDFTG